MKIIPEMRQEYPKAVRGFLETEQDMKWLAEVHLPTAGVLRYACAILYGNEDCPTRIELFARNHITSKPAIWVWSDEADGYIMAERGHKPKPGRRKHRKGISQ